MHIFKKITAYSFILIANIVLLAHTFIPHQHHLLIPAIECSSSLNDNAGHRHTPLASNHHHEGETSTDCILSQAVILPSNQVRIEAKFIFYLNNHLPDLLFSISDAGNDVFIPKKIFIKAVSDRSFAYQSRISTSLGLRAPPVA